MAGLIPAIGMHIAWLAALMTMGNHMAADTLSQPFVEYEIAAQEFVFNTFFLYLVGIVNDTTLEMEYMMESMMQHISTGLFTTDPTCTIHDDVGVFFIPEHVYGHRQLLSKGIPLRIHNGCAYRLLS